MNEKTKISRQAIKENRKIKLLSFLHSKTAVIGFLITTVMILLALFAPVIAPEGPYVNDAANRLKPPSALYIMGTDKLGRSVWVRILYGIRISLIVGGITTIVSMILGTVFGILAGYFQVMDTIVMRICESLAAIPPILMAIALMSAFSSDMKSVIIAMCIVYTPVIARVARASTLSVKEMTYIEAIKSQGAGTLTVLFSHILPNILSPIIVQGTYTFAIAIILEAALSFLGAGIPAPIPSLGNILYEAKGVIFNSWWMTIFPSIAMVLLAVGINLLGDGIRDVLDPTLN